MPSTRILATALALLALTPAVAQADQIDISVLSSRADQVSGGDALMRVDAPPGLLDKLRRAPQRHRRDRRVRARGTATSSGSSTASGSASNELTVTHNRQLVGASAGAPDAHQLPERGADVLRARTRSSSSARRSRPGSASRWSTTRQGDGFRVLNPTAPPPARASTARANTRVDYQYRTTGGSFAAAAGRRLAPGDMAQTTLLDGRTVDYVVRRERGTINRFIYSFAMLAPFGESPATSRTPRSGTAA